MHAGRPSPPTSEDKDTALPNFEGAYVLTGAYSGRDGPGVEGTLQITHQSGTAATADLSVKLLDRGNTFFALNMPSDVLAATAPSGTAQLRKDGQSTSLSLEFSGKEEIFGIDPAACCTYTLSLEGALSGGAISGTWTLTTDMPSLDKGTFSAARRT